MKYRLLHPYFLAFLLLFTVFALAQKDSFDIYGTIIDERNKNPIPLATIIILVIIQTKVFLAQLLMKMESLAQPRILQIFISLL